LKNCFVYKNKNFRKVSLVFFNIILWKILKNGSIIDEEETELFKKKLILNLITHYPLPITHYPLSIIHLQIYPLTITHIPIYPYTHYPYTHYPLPIYPLPIYPYTQYPSWLKYPPNKPKHVYLGGTSTYVPLIPPPYMKIALIISRDPRRVFWWYFGFRNYKIL
jgi:hypothetical protein